MTTLVSSPMATLTCDVVFDVQDALGEGPCWDHRTQELHWVDLLSKRLFRGDPATGRFDTWQSPWAAARVTPCDDADSLLVSFLRQPAVGRFGGEDFVPIALGDAVIERQRFNDGACDARGRFWTCSYDGTLATASGRMVCFEGGQAVRKADGMAMPNGIRFSPDGSQLYFVDSRPGRVWVYDFDLQEGQLGQRRLLLDYSGSGIKPDGCAIDTDGCLWIAEVNRARVARYTPDGRLDAAIAVPTDKPTSASFGGDDGRTLFITSRTDGLSPPQRAAQPHAGAVFAARVQSPGVAEHPFRMAPHPAATKGLAPQPKATACQ